MSPPLATCTEQKIFTNVSRCYTGMQPSPIFLCGSVEPESRPRTPPPREGIRVKKEVAVVFAPCPPGERYGLRRATRALHPEWNDVENLPPLHDFEDGQARITSSQGPPAPLRYLFGVQDQSWGLYSTGAIPWFLADPAASRTPSLFPVLARESENAAPRPSA